MTLTVALAGFAPTTIVLSVHGESSIGGGGKMRVIAYSTDATPPTIGRGK